VATIFPKNKDNTRDILQSDAKSAFFEELEGGTREYILTLSSIITDSKMKGSPECVANSLQKFSASPSCISILLLCKTSKVSTRKNTKL
jgi:hypothetical protein